MAKNSSSRNFRSVVVISLVICPLFTLACGGTSPTAPTSPTSTPQAQAPTVPSAPTLSVKAAELIKQYNIDYYGGGVGTVRWTKKPITVWADSNFSQEDLFTVLNFWNTSTNGVIQLMASADEPTADIRLSTHWPPVRGELVTDATCAVGGPSSIRLNVVTAGLAEFAFLERPTCRLSMAFTMAHELGHALLPFGGHLQEGDILSVPHPKSNELWMSPLLLEITNWLYAVPPWTKL